MQTELEPTRPTRDLVVEIFAKAMRAATLWLEYHRERINGLNVFPVPDGDTGDNMLLTMRGAIRAVDRVSPHSLADACDALAEGALQGSRGNSGVILSQMLHGFSQELRSATRLTPGVLAAAFNRAAEQGYKAHSEPVEGTMMTVARDLAREAALRAEEGLSMPQFLRAVLREAKESVARTQTLLPRLQQAGVVDAGGEGIAVLIEGVVRYLSGQPMDEPIASEQTSTGADFGALDLPEDDVFGYCTNFMLKGENMDVDAFREKVLSMGRSALVVGNPQMIKVHVHTEQPGDILSHALTVGKTLHQLKLDNMDDQYQAMVGEKAKTQPATAVTTALVAVTAGDGLRRLFENDAQAHVVAGGQSMNPSTGDLLCAIEESPSESVILLPNNPNVIMSAQKAAEASKKQVRVLPTKSTPVGIVAALAYSPDAHLDDNFGAMTQAIEGVAGIEVTRAIRDADIDGVSAKKGDYIGLVNDKLVSADPDLSALLVATLEKAGADEKELLTLYPGEGSTPEQVDAATEAVQKRWPDLQIDSQFGGQPHYLLIASLE